MIVYSIIAYMILFVIVRPLAQLFSGVEEVIDVVVLYMRIIPLGYGMQGILLIYNGSLNALHEPIKAASINVIQMLVIYAPIAFIVSSLYGIAGIFIALVSSYMITYLYANYLTKKSLINLEQISINNY